MNEEKLLRLVEKGRFEPQAYGLVLAALEVAVAQKGSHVSGGELLEALAALVAKRFGLMAAAVLGEWGIRCSEDVGEIVFDLVNAGIMTKRPEDSKEDFKNWPLFETIRFFVEREPIVDAFIAESEERFGRGMSKQEEQS